MTDRRGNISRRRTMPVKNWSGAMNQFAILFDGRVPMGGSAQTHLHRILRTPGHDDVRGHSPLNLRNAKLFGESSYGDHNTDKTASDPAKARRMVGATWRALLEYIKVKKCGCNPRWDNSWWGAINNFIGVETSSPRTSTIDAEGRALDNPGLGDPDATLRKRRFLGLNDRYTNRW
jgi:hypothetical protein